MLYILFCLFIALIIIGCILGFDDDGFGLVICGSIFGTITLIVLLFVLAFYNGTKSTNSEQIAVLEERNTEILEQIEPLVNKYLDYEKDSYDNLKLNPNTLVALSAYPELKGNEFVMKQINVVLLNQQQITDLKLEYAKLESYRMWIFVGKD